MTVTREGKRRLARASAIAFLAAAGVARAQRVEIPSRFEADRVYATLRTASGQPLELYTDSGGGGLILTRAAALRVGLASKPVTDPDVIAELGPDAREAAAPALDPAMPPLPGDALITAGAHQIAGWPEQGDGFVGAPWFAGGVWTWDYPGRHLYREPATWAPARTARVVPLTFKSDAEGVRPTNFARIVVRIDARETPMLLDTGAETFLTPQAIGAIGDHGPAFRAASMIMASDFDAWRKAHPDWPVIENAQAGTRSAMILVPSVDVAGWSTGPVWFTRREDDAYLKFMSGMMSAPVEGSLGGNALKAFAMTIDYPASRAAFSRPAAR